MTTQMYRSPIIPKSTVHADATAPATTSATRKQPVAQPGREAKTSQPTYRRLQRAFFAACLILGPSLMLLSVFLNPARTVDSNSGGATIAAHIAAGTVLSPLDFGIMVTELFLLPFGALGMASLAMRRSPWLASIGGFLSITGAIAFVVFVGQEVQSRLMAQLGGGPQFVTLWDRFNTDPVIVAYLSIFIIGSLIGPALLGIGLGRTRLIPRWAMWALILRAPIQVAGFVTHIGLSVEFVTFGLLLVASIPVAVALLTDADEINPVHPAAVCTPHGE
jgi:hypothetical protein